MTFYFIIIGLVFIGLAYKAYNNLLTFMDKLERSQEQIKRQLAQMQEKLSQPAPPFTKVYIEKQEITEPAKEEKPVVAPPVEKIVETPATEPLVTAEEPLITEPEKEEPVIEPVEEKEPEEAVVLTNENPVSQDVRRPLTTDTPTLGKLMDSYKKNEIDYEKYIGENLVSKIGIAILVFAIALFVKYAIDNDWIGPVGRVCVGLLSGGILIGLAHRLRKDYAAFTSVLVGGGLAVFYFTMSLAYHQYHLFNQTTSFGIMVVITIFAVVLSLLYDRQELAVISLVGGYATPFMVSNGSGNYMALFSYLCILNTGILVIAYMRIWRILNVLAFVFTFVIFDAWLFNLPYDTPVSTYSNGFIFAGVFFLFFFVSAVVNNIRENKKFLPADFSMLLANSVQYFGIGLMMLESMKAAEYRGLFSACMATFHLGASFFLFRRQSADKNILFLLIGITLTFISITAPLQLDGNFITLFWASESVVLLWLYQRSGIRIISYGANIVWCITLISLVLLWSNNYGLTYNHKNILTIIANKAFISAAYVGLCTGFIYYLSGRELTFTETEKYYPDITLPRPIFLIAATFIFFLAGALEIGYQFDQRFDIALSVMYLVLYLLVFASALLYLIKRLNLISLSDMVQAIISAVLIGLFMISLPLIFDSYHTMLREDKYLAYFTAHWISAIIIAGLIYKLIAQLRKVEQIQDAYTGLTWIISSLVIVFLSAEVYFLVFGLFYKGTASEDSIDNVFLKACLPILWGLCSFGFMWVGMRDRFRPLRIFSLVLFSVTLLKLFAYDIRNVPVAGKIAAFFCLGVLLLVVSFMYQRLKNLIIHDGENDQK